MSHTQGRLVVGRQRGAVLPIESEAPDVEGQIVADVGFGRSGEVDEANARRLVACWNACEKVSLEDLEAINRPADVSFAVNVDRLVRERDSLRAVNAELLEALEGVIPYMEAAESAGLVGDEGCHWPVESVRAAIASARKQGGQG